MASSCLDVLSSSTPDMTLNFNGATVWIWVKPISSAKAGYPAHTNLICTVRCPLRPSARYDDTRLPAQRLCIMWSCVCGVTAITQADVARFRQHKQATIILASAMSVSNPNLSLVVVTYAMIDYLGRMRVVALRWCTHRTCFALSLPWTVVLGVRCPAYGRCRGGLLARKPTNRTTVDMSQKNNNQTLWWQSTSIYATLGMPGCRSWPSWAALRQSWHLAIVLEHSTIKSTPIKYERKEMMRRVAEHRIPEHSCVQCWKNATCEHIHVGVPWCAGADLLAAQCQSA